MLAAFALEVVATFVAVFALASAYGPRDASVWPWFSSLLALVALASCSCCEVVPATSLSEDALDEVAKCILASVVAPNPCAV